MLSRIPRREGAGDPRNCDGKFRVAETDIAL